MPIEKNTKSQCNFWFDIILYLNETSYNYIIVTINIQTVKKRNNGALLNKYIITLKRYNEYWMYLT